MARRVFFSFQYERDNQRASIVRNSWVTKADREEAGFIDAADWEAVKKKGDGAVENWIENQLKNTTVTVVLIGKETSSRPWVRHEVRRSYERGNGQVGILIHNILDWNKNRDDPGNNQFGELAKTPKGDAIYFWELYQTYDWVLNNGYENLGAWVEEAAKKAGK